MPILTRILTIDLMPNIGPSLAGQSPHHRCVHQQSVPKSALQAQFPFGVTGRQDVEP